MEGLEEQAVRFERFVSLLKDSDNIELIESRYKEAVSLFNESNDWRKAHTKTLTSYTKRIEAAKKDLHKIFKAAKAKKKVKQEELFSQIDATTPDTLEAEIKKQAYELEPDKSYRVSFSDDVDMQRVFAILVSEGKLGLIEKVCAKACASSQKNIFETVKGVEIWEE